jgi:hypothetical protein
VVRDEDGRLLGGITTSRLIRQLLGARLLLIARSPS